MSYMHFCYHRYLCFSCQTGAAPPSCWGSSLVRRAVSTTIIQKPNSSLCHSYQDWRSKRTDQEGLCSVASSPLGQTGNTEHYCDILSCLRENRNDLNFGVMANGLPNMTTHSQQHRSLQIRLPVSSFSSPKMKSGCCCRHRLTDSFWDR